MSKSITRGRPRAFDKETALDQALNVFIDKGYQGASLDDLTSAMGINRPSMYSAFGNKEDLFIAAITAFIQPQHLWIREVLFSTPSVQDAFANFFKQIVEYNANLKSCKGKMGGCVLVNSTVLSCQDETKISIVLKNLHEEKEALFFERLEMGVKEGELSPECDIRALAQYFNAVLQGVGVLARIQQSETVLENILTTALGALKRD